MFSQRGTKLLGKSSPITEAHIRCASDPYGLNNISGYLNLGTAENRLCWDRMKEKLPTCYDAREEDIHYQPLEGMLALREQLARFLSRTLRGQIAFNRILIGSGATAILDMLAYALAEPGEAFLVPAPYYPGFTVDLAGRSEVGIVSAPLESKNGYRLTREALEAGVKEAKAQGVTLRALLISSPNNPLGTVLSAEEVKLAIEFGRQRGFPVIFDEVYGNSVYSGRAFESAMYWREQYPDYKENVYLVYSLSKDFSLSGYRIGVFHCLDRKFLKIMTKLIYFGTIPADTQRAMAHMLADEVWVDAYLAENRRRLGRAAAQWKNLVESQTAAKVLPAEAGFFAWIDLRCALAKQDFASESALTERLLEKRLSILPGRFFGCTEPGWFRACIAHPDATLQLAAERLVSAIQP